MIFCVCALRTKCLISTALLINDLFEEAWPWTWILILNLFFYKRPFSFRTKKSCMNCVYHKNRYRLYIIWINRSGEANRIPPCLLRHLRYGRENKNTTELLIASTLPQKDFSPFLSYIFVLLCILYFEFRCEGPRPLGYNCLRTINDMSTKPEHLT